MRTGYLYALAAGLLLGSVGCTSPDDGTEETDESEAAFSGPAPFIFEDVDNDGVFNASAGDHDITAEILDDGAYSTKNGIVFPARARKLATNLSLEILAGGNITILSPIESLKGDVRIGTGPSGSGSLRIGSSVRAAGVLDLEAVGNTAVESTVSAGSELVIAGKGLVVSSKVRAQCHGPNCFARLGSWGGGVAVGDRASVTATGSIGIDDDFGGDITIGDSAVLRSVGSGGEAWLRTAAEKGTQPGSISVGTRALLSAWNRIGISSGHNISIGAGSLLRTTGDEDYAAVTIYSSANHPEDFVKNTITMNHAKISNASEIYVWGGAIDFTDNIVNLPPKKSSLVTIGNSKDYLMRVDVSRTTFLNLGSDDELVMAGEPLIK